MSWFLWWVAFGTIAMAAVLSPSERTSVMGVALAGFVVTGCAVGIDAFAVRTARRPDDATFLTSVLIAFVAVEMLGFAVARGEGEVNQAAWFAAAVGFASIGMLAAWRGGGSDGAVASQLFFHLVMVLPAIAPIGKILVVAIGSPEAIAAFQTSGPITKMLLVIGGIAMPLLFTALMFTLFHDVGNRDERRPPVWPTLLVSEAAYVVIAVRWSYDGL